MSGCLGLGGQGMMPQEEHKGNVASIGVFCILIMVIVTQVYKFSKLIEIYT